MSLQLLSTAAFVGVVVALVAEAAAILIVEAYDFRRWLKKSLTRRRRARAWVTEFPRFLRANIDWPRLAVMTAKLLAAAAVVGVLVAIFGVGLVEVAT